MKYFTMALFTGFALIFSGCNDADDNHAANGTAETEKIEPGDVEDGEVPVGKSVTLKGEVTKIYDAHTFALSDEGIDFEKDLIVVSKEPLPFKTEDDAMVTVTGTVAKFSVIEVEKEYSWDFDPQIEIELEDVKWYLKDAKVTVTKPADD